MYNSIKLIFPETGVSGLHFCHSQYTRSSANFELFWRNPKHVNTWQPIRRQTLKQNGRSRPLKVIYFGVNEKPLKDCICGLVWESSDDIVIERKKRKSPFSTIPLSFDAPSPANTGEYQREPYLVRNCDLCATFLPLILWVCLHSHFLVGSEKHVTHNGRSRSIQGQRRSLTLVPIQSAWAT